MSRAPHRTLALAFAGLAVGVGAYWLVLASEHEPNPKGVMFLFVLLGWSFMGSGLAATARRPDSRFGAILTAVGFAWAAAALTESNSDAVFTLGMCVNSVWFAVFAHAVLVYPDGRVDGRIAKMTIATAYAATTVVQVIGVLGVDPDRDIADCAELPCPDNLLLVGDGGDLFPIAQAVQASLAIGVFCGLLAVLLRRWRGASTSQRRSLAPLFWSTGLFFVVFVLVAGLELLVGLSEDVSTGITLGSFATVPLALLGGIWASRSPGTLGRLVVDLSAQERGGVRDALARALGDPSIELAYWIPASQGYVDSAGRPIELTDRPTTIVEHAGAPIAALLHDASLSERPALVRSACAAAGIALANERLQAELRARLDDLRASRARLVEAGDTERRRLERNLHDGAQQRLVSLSLSLRLARSALDRDPAEANRVLASAEEELAAALAELRELARGIHPAILSDRGLEPALRALAGRQPMPVSVRCPNHARLPDQVEAAAYYVAAEALTNTARYAEASHAEVTVDHGDGLLIVRIADDGVGGADPSHGTGLRGLRDRVEALDGRLSVVSAPGDGTIVEARIPVDAPSPR